MHTDFKAGSQTNLSVIERHGALKEDVGLGCAGLCRDGKIKHIIHICRDCEDHVEQAEP